MMLMPISETHRICKEANDSKAHKGGSDDNSAQA